METNSTTNHRVTIFEFDGLFHTYVCNTVHPDPVAYVVNEYRHFGFIVPPRFGIATRESNSLNGITYSQIVDIRSNGRHLVVAFA